MFCPHFSYCRLFVFHSVPGLLFFIFHYKTLQCSSDLGMLMCSRTMKPNMQKNQSPWDLSFLSLGQPLQPRWWLRWWRVCLQCARPGVDPPVRKISWRRKYNPLQCSCLENPVNRGTRRAAVQGVAKTQTGLSVYHFHFSSSSRGLEVRDGERQVRGPRGPVPLGSRVCGTPCVDSA